MSLHAGHPELYISWHLVVFLPSQPKDGAPGLAGRDVMTECTPMLATYVVVLMLVDRHQPEAATRARTSSITFVSTVGSIDGD